MSTVTAGQALVAFAESGARFVSARSRVDGTRVLLRVEMPDPPSARWARAVLEGAGLDVGGNDTPWETQVVFTVPAAALDSVYAEWRQTSMPNHRAGRSLGAGPSCDSPT